MSLCRLSHSLKGALFIYQPAWDTFLSKMCQNQQKNKGFIQVKIYTIQDYKFSLQMSCLKNGDTHLHTFSSKMTETINYLDSC